jgi:hypothetical protein
MFKPRKDFKRYTPEDFDTRSKRAVGGSSRMANLDDDVNDEEEKEEEEEEEEPLRLERPKRKKIAIKRGRGGKNTRGRN